MGGPTGLAGWARKYQACSSGEALEAGCHPLDEALQLESSLAGSSGCK